MSLPRAVTAAVVTPGQPATTVLAVDCIHACMLRQWGSFAGEKQPAQVVLTEGPILGGGAFSRVSVVTGALMSFPCCIKFPKLQHDSFALVLFS